MWALSSMVAKSAMLRGPNVRAARYGLNASIIGLSWPARYDIVAGEACYKCYPVALWHCREVAMSQARMLLPASDGAGNRGRLVRRMIPSRGRETWHDYPSRDTWQTNRAVTRHSGGIWWALSHSCACVLHLLRAWERDAHKLFEDMPSVAPKWCRGYR